MHRKIESVRRRFAALPRWLGLFPLLAALLLAAAAALQFADSLCYVTVRDGGAARILLTAGREPGLIIKEAGLTLNADDEVEYLQNGATAELLIRRAFSVTLRADGESLTAQVAEGTVADLLKISEVSLSGEDYVRPAPETPLAPGLVAQVHRVTYEENERREVLSGETVDAYIEALPEDAEFVKSHNATYDATYRHRLVNGEVEGSEMLSLVPVVAPRPADSYTFTEGVPCSRIAGFDDVEMGPNGLPLNYTSVWEGAVCTAYSSSGGSGASGLGLYCGTAAVNPELIPYGSRMYVTSADGSFIYGFCIATDTGIAMMEGAVDLDLYFETNAECLQFGKRGLNVYFLD